MDLPRSLPALLYLLAYNLEKDRMYPNRRLGRALRAAALTELYRDGLIVDDGGAVRLVASASAPLSVSPPDASVSPAAGAGVGGAGIGGAGIGGAVARVDPVVTAVFEQIRSAPRRRTWAEWISVDDRSAVVETRDDLESAGWIRVARGQALGILPVSAVVLLHRPAVRRLNRAAGRVLRDQVTPDQADRDLVALIPLAAAGDVITLVNVGQRKAYAGRIAELAELAGPAVTALAALSRSWRSPIPGLRR